MDNLNIDFENITLRLEASHRGGGIEIDLEPLGYLDGAKMTAYQNYLGGGMLGKIQNDCNMEEWQTVEGLPEIAEALARHFHAITNHDYDEWESVNFEQSQNMPASAY